MSNVSSDTPKAVVRHPGGETPAKSKRFYTPLSATVLALVAFLAAQAAAGLAVAMYPALKGWSTQQASDWLEQSVMAQFAFFMLAELTMLSAITALLRHRQQTLKAIGVLKARFSEPFMAVGGFVVYVFLARIASGLMEKFTTVDLDQKQQIGFEGAHGWELILVFGALVVLTPFVEEVVFRGFVYHGIRRKASFIVTSLIVSLVFGALHLQFGSGAPLLWAAMVDTFIMSMVICVIREKTGSIWGGVYLHGIKNFFAFLYLYTSVFK